MALSSGFFNDKNGDRAYDAEQMSQIFDGIIRDGVYETIGDRFQVTPGEGMTVMVGSGRAWFDHTWTLNDNTLLLQLDPSETSLNRIDLVVLEVNSSEETRENTIKIVKGTPAVNPVRPDLVKTYFINQYPLAAVLVRAGITTPTTYDITNLVGTSECPFVIGVLEIMTIDQIVNQWRAEFEQWMSVNSAEFRAWFDPFVTDTESTVNAWVDTFENNMASWQTNQRTAFNNWFANIQYVLDGDVAGHLQNEIDEFKNSALTAEEIQEIWDRTFGGGE